jgi:hypothetical protein
VTPRPALDFEKLRQQRLFLAAPLYGNQLHFGYHRSVCHLQTQCFIQQIHLGMKYAGCDSLVPRARNRLVTYFLESRDSDLLFVDSDIAFTPEDVFSLMMCSEPIVGGVYPRKQLDWHRIARAARSGVHPDQLPYYGYVPVMNWLGEGDFPLDSLIEVKHLGTGFMRIKREVFTAMIDQLGDHITFDYHSDEPQFQGKIGYDFFPTGPDVRYALGSGGRQYLSEDWGFCELARQCGFKAYAAPWIRLTHSGYMDYSGSLEVMDAGIDALLSEVK